MIVYASENDRKEIRQEKITSEIQPCDVQTFDIQICALATCDIRTLPFHQQPSIAKLNRLGWKHGIRPSKAVN